MNSLCFLTFVFPHLFFFGEFPLFSEYASVLPEWPENKIKKKEKKYPRTTYMPQYYLSGQSVLRDHALTFFFYDSVFYIFTTLFSVCFYRKQSN